VVELINEESGFLFLGVLKEKIRGERRWGEETFALLSFRLCLAVQQPTAEARGANRQTSANNLYLPNSKSTLTEDKNMPSPRLEISERAENPLGRVEETLRQQVQRGPDHYRMRIKAHLAAIGVKHFCQNANQHLLSLLQRSISQEAMSPFLQKTACLEIFYDQEGGLQKISTTSDSDPDFAALLKDKIQWDSLSSPGKYGLPHKAVKIHIGIGPDGQFNLQLDPL
jgi:hypothetical protein